MKACVAFLIVGLLIGCSSTPLELPTCTIPGPSPEVGMSLSVPEMPVEVAETETTATFDLEGLLQLERVHKASLANETIAKENALALTARNEEITELIECARYSTIWMEVREDMIKTERRDHFIDNLFYRSVIVLGIGVTLL